MKPFVDEPIEKNNLFRGTEDFTFPLEEIYFAFGDESITPTGVFYGIALIPESVVKQAEDLVIAQKLRYGGTPETPLHCRELFSYDARKKSGWSHLSKDQAVEMCGHILRELASLQPKYLMGHIPSTYYPKRFRLKGKNGHPDLVHNIDKKWLALWTYFHIAALLDPVEIQKPDDPISNPRPRNLPFWQMVMRRSEPGLRVRKVFLDREHSDIRWFSKSFKWETVAKELVVENLAGASHLPLVMAKEEKHVLLEVADIFVYSVARSMSCGQPLEYRNFFAEVYVKLLWGLGEEIVLGAR